MKSLILVLLLVIAPAGFAMADNDIGCGVGTMIWEGQTGLAPKIAGSFTNALTFQSISITFGIVNCNGQNTVTASAEIRRFVSVNLDALAREMAIGEGETLESFAHLLEVGESDRANFYSLTQDHFTELFTNDHTTAGDMLTHLERLLSTDAALYVYAQG